MTLYRRGSTYHVDVRWQGYPRIRQTTRTINKARAQAIERTLHLLRDAGRKDILGLLAEGKLNVVEVHEAWIQRGDELAQLTAKAQSPELGTLVEEWLAYLESPAGISPRTKRPYAPETIRRYKVSWEGFFEVLPLGRSAQLSDLTSGFLSEYRNQRVLANGGSSRNSRPDGVRPSPATINRDLIALSSFLRWCREIKKIAVVQPRIVRERESVGPYRWLSAEEVQAVAETCPQEWWPLFATLIQTGMRIGEALGLRWGDVNSLDQRISIHERYRRVKTASSVRDVPISDPLAVVLTAHANRMPSGPADCVFPDDLYWYDRARAVWQKVCLAAGLHDRGEKPKPNATIHDLRHTYGVAAAKAGIPLVRIQQLMGHASPHMTLRYMMHTPEAHFREDAQSITSVLLGSWDGKVTREVNPSDRQTA